MKEKHVILFGVPRSGSTWLSQVLSANAQLELIHEPDNELTSFFGLCCKAKMPRFPYLSAEDNNDQYKRLFEAVLIRSLAHQSSWKNRFCYKLMNLSRSSLQAHLSEHGTALLKVSNKAKWLCNMLLSKNSNKRKLIKTVHANLAIPFLMSNFDLNGLVLLRNPLSVFSSYLSLEMQDMDRRIYDNSALLNDLKVQLPDINAMNRYNKSGLQLALFYKFMELQLNKNEQLIPIYSENLLNNPVEQIKSLYEKLGLEHTEQVSRFILSRMKPGTGYQTFRDPSE